MFKSFHNRKKTKSGFTVIEILVTIAIIGLLGSLILPRLSTAKTKARIAKTEEQLHQIRNALEALAGETTEWPGHLPVGIIDAGAANNEIWDLTTQSAGLLSTDGLYNEWSGPYLPNLPTDPWGNNYFLDTDYDIGTSTTIWAAVVGSFGPNGVGQNVYDSDNIIRIIQR